MSSYRRIKVTALAGFALLASPLLSVAQQPDTVQRQHTATIRRGTTLLHDAFLAPDTASGATTSFQYKFSARSSNRYSSLTAGYGQNNASASDAALKAHSVSLSWSDGFRVFKKASNRLSAYTGYRIEAAALGASSTGKATGRSSWNTFTTLSLYQSVAYTAGSHALSLEVSVPLAGLYSRPAGWYHTGDNYTTDNVLASLYTGSSFVSLHNYRAVDARLAYSRQLSRRLGLSLHYDFLFKNDRQQNRFYYKEHGLGVSVSYGLR
ncbi:hypothetical protein V9K67_06690 [Paraflavisolibacter sp. H34]|uniref:hypothetical protein n=1 Tax=Huijunlia imazamoxiresistens TaxID=3127457 RepID=UPI003018DDA1